MMSTQNTLSRREVVSLLGVTTGSVVATTVTAQYSRGPITPKSSAPQRRRARTTSLVMAR